MATKIKILTGVVAVVAAVWTGGWFFVRDQLGKAVDGELTRLAGEGVEIDCPDRSISGFPFRMALSCTRPSARLPDGSRVSAEAIAATWHVVDPMLVLVALKAPVEMAAANGDGATIGFEQLRASVRAEDFRLARLSIESDKLVVDTRLAGTPSAHLSADHAEIHARHKAGTDDALEVAVTSAGLLPRLGGDDLLPAPAAAAANVTLTALSLFGGDAARLAAWAGQGGEVKIDAAAIEIGETRLSASGSLGLAADGRPRGAIDAEGRGIAWLTDQVKAGRPVPPALANLAASFALLGRAKEGDLATRVLRIAVTDGALTANGLPLGSAPPMF